MTLPLSRATSVLVALLAAWAPTAAAQLDSALLSKLRFNLTNPGGKSLAMGGAFSAIADDATAALANPAGLGLISSIEIAVSGKRVNETLALSTARSVATGSLVTPYPPVQTSSVGLDASTTGVEFAGVVVPISRRLVAALTYAENLRFEGDAGPGGYPYLELRDNRSGGTTRRDFLYEYREYGSAKLSNRLLAASLAYRVTESLRLGGGVTLNRSTFDLDGDAGGPHRIVSQTYLSPTVQETLTTTLGVQGLGGTQVGFVAGVHADLIADGKLTFGADYRWTQAAEGTLVIGGYVPTALAGQTARTFKFRVPSDASVGLAAHPMPGLTIAAEVQWVRYGDIFDRALPVVSYAGLVGPAGYPVRDVLADLSPAPNVFVPRLGFEYVAGSKDVRVALRVGYHREPAHGVTASLAARDGSGQPYPITDPPFSEGVAAVFDGGKADDRFTGGLGLTVSRALSVDFGFDVGRDSQQFAVSLFYRF
ncbi:MAG: outer membrane protein transport protein [Acidobacteria bacterium]|nr:outer membrane protein transport protein [Acidobacteriota bacterium]